MKYRIIAIMIFKLSLNVLANVGELGRTVAYSTLIGKQESVNGMFGNYFEYTMLELKVNKIKIVESFLKLTHHILMKLWRVN